MNKKNLKYCLWFLLALAVLIIDHTLKYLILQKIPLNTALNVFPFFNLFFVMNKGAALSLLSHASGWQNWFLGGIALVAALIIINWFFALGEKKNLVRFSLMLILGGALGNCLDRILYGQVLDYLDFFYQSWHFPIFNFADTAITIGIMLLAFDFIWGKRPRKN
jgi:signal peptidase II